jgi:ribonuclease HI
MGDTYKIVFQGKCSGNPGPMTAVATILNETQRDIENIREELGEGTNNVAAYMCLEKVLEKLLEKMVEKSEINISGSNKVVIDQVNLVGNPKSPALVTHRVRVFDLMQRVERRGNKVKIIFR